jgi:glucan phosphoethanolaminetransferase (alkaline phosphatase superfamily)
VSDSINENFLVTVLNNSANHIQFMKKQQWTITYYCLLLYAAIIAIFKTHLANASCLERGVLLAISAVLCLIGCILIFTFEKSMKEHRTIVENIYRSFPEEKKIVFANTPSGSAPTDVPLVRATLIASLIIGLVVVGWVLYRNLIFA